MKREIRPVAEERALCCGSFNNRGTEPQIKETGHAKVYHVRGNGCAAAKGKIISLPQVGGLHHRLPESGIRVIG